ncbi:glycosyltransferase family protein [Citrobacter sedlakii]|uniref:glycosyltransferase family 1 protein n=1 Tax=Citrobacter sedlakii TaxID=67826 RepID=UPI002B230EF9|nr:glycosyltransferase family 1 protein [Citrobacter sedlakii]MEB0951761.1 glycosyltransferase family 1 protein [Citrobacter sedlakii]
MMILFYTGSYPPDKCGVGDYLYNLNKSLTQMTSTVIIKSGLWDYVRNILLSKDKIQLINIQYPTVGYSKNKFTAFTPHLAFLFAFLLNLNISLTLHEYSSLSRRARIFLKIFKLCKTIIVTNIYEYEVLATDGFKPSRIKIIPIASNIPMARKSKNKIFDVVYFGIISKGKGIEHFFDAVTNLKMVHPEANILLLGFKPGIDLKYEENVLQKANLLNIKLILNKDENEVAELLASSRIALLPFPDGISERRGTALAAMQNDALIISYKGKFSSSFKDKCILCNTLDELKTSLINNYLRPDDSLQLLKAASIYAESFRWEQIAQQYKELSDENCH